MDDPDHFLEVEVRKHATFGIKEKGEKTGTTTKKAKLTFIYLSRKIIRVDDGRRRWRNPFPDRVFSTE